MRSAVLLFTVSGGELGACKAALKRSQVALAVYALAMAIHLLVVNHVLAEEHGGVLC